MYVCMGLQSAEEFSWSYEPVHSLRFGRRMPEVLLLAADHEEFPGGLNMLT